MSDAFNALRSYFRRLDEVKVEEDRLHFGTQSFDLKTEVLEVKDKSYSVYELFLLLSTKGTKEYIEKCNQAKVKWIPNRLTKGVTQLFSGMNVSASMMRTAGSDYLEQGGDPSRH